MTQRLQDVGRRVGIRRMHTVHNFHTPDWRLTAVTGQELGLWFSWNAPFLTLKAWHGASGQSLSESSEFKPGAEKLLAAHAHFGAPTQHLTTFLAENNVLSALVDRSAEIHLLFCIDTDTDDFRAACRARTRQDAPLEVYLGTHAFDANADEDPGQIKLVLTNLELPEALEGYLALDLGNTSSTLALHGGHLLGTAKIEIIDGEVVGGCSAVADLPRQQLTSSANSAVRVDVVEREWVEKGFRDHPETFVWAVGSAPWRTATPTASCWGRNGCWPAASRIG